MARRPQPTRNARTTARTPVRAKAAKRPWWRDRRWLIFIPVIPLVGLIFLYSTIVYGFTPPPELMQGARGLDIVDRNGQPLFSFGDEPGSGTVVPLNQISQDMINATVAVEDAGFWSNPTGISPKGIARAVYENLAFWENGGFFNGSGGSSITQQLAKNLYISPEERLKRSPVRKIKETLIAFELSRRYSKQQILEWYLGNVYYGHGAYGIDSASRRYFNKAPIDLTLPEAALLAGLPQAPSIYDPLTDFEQGMTRQKQVLVIMERHGFLSEAQLQEMLAAPVELNEGEDPSAADRSNYLAPHFASYVRDLLPSLLGASKVSGQLKVTTTIDASLQQKAESIVESQLDKFEAQYGATNGALVSMDPNTGEILAMVGSHDFLREDISGQVNNALALNEPGSTMKPVTYLTAIMKGWTPATIIEDSAIKLGSGDASYTVGNADGRYRGNVTLRNALGSSLNVPAVKALQYAGLEQVYGQAKRMGVSSLRELSNYGPAFTLGGVDVNLLDMTYVYSVLAAQGEQAGMQSILESSRDSREFDPIAVLKIETPDGKVIWRPKTGKQRVVPANATYLITNILADDNARVSMFGANSPLNLQGRPSAVKSGSSDETRDLWAIGYTPQLVTGVWVGNADNAPMTGATSSYVAAPIWREFMTAAHQGKQVMQFSVPEGVVTARVCATTGQAPANNCPRVINEVFLSNRLPSGLSPATTPSVTPTPQRTVSPTPQTGTPTPSPTPTRQTQVTPTPPSIPTPQPTNTPVTIPGLPPTPTQVTGFPTMVPTPTQQVQPSPTARPPTSTPQTGSPGTGGNQQQQGGNNGGGPPVQPIPGR